MAISSLDRVPEKVEDLLFRGNNLELFSQMSEMFDISAATQVMPELFKTFSRKWWLMQLSVLSMELVAMSKRLTFEETMTHRRVMLCLSLTLLDESHPLYEQLRASGLPPFDPQVEIVCMEDDEPSATLNIRFNDMQGMFGFIVCSDQSVSLPWSLFTTKKKLPAGKEHCVYIHTIDTLQSDADVGAGDFQLTEDKKTYVGLTKQGPIKRFKAHLTAARTGRGSYLFQTALRDCFGDGTGKILITHVAAYGLDFVEAMNLEERLVEDMSLYPRGLNMIPGGFAGAKYLNSRGVKAAPYLLSENRDQFIRKLPSSNPLISAHWSDPEYAAKVLCGWGKRLDAQLVKEIQFYKEIGWEYEKVASRLGVDSDQIKKVFDGKTYSRLSAT